MKVVDRKTFLTYPEGTIFCKGREWFFDEFLIKGETYEPTEDYVGDFVYLDMSWAEGPDSNTSFDILMTSLETGASFVAQEGWSRDGCFDEKDIFLIYEEADLLKLKEHVELALTIEKYKGRENV